MNSFQFWIEWRWKCLKALNKKQMHWLKILKFQKLLENVTIARNSTWNCSQVWMRIWQNLGVIILAVLEIWVMSNNLLESCLKSVSDSKSPDLKYFFSSKTIQNSQFRASLPRLPWVCSDVGVSERVFKQIFTYLDLFEHQRPLGFRGVRRYPLKLDDGR